MLSVAGGKVTLRKPAHLSGNKRRAPRDRRQLCNRNDHQIRFSVAEYDHTQPLTIDPVLNYSTYLGGRDSSIRPLASRWMLLAMLTSLALPRRRSFRK